MTKQTSTLMGKLKLTYSPIRLRMANQQVVNPFGQLKHVSLDIDRVKTFSYFEVIEIVDDIFPYPALLGIDCAFNNSTVDLKKRCMNFLKDKLRVITPLDLDEGQWYIEPIRE
jgi:hypothetical protein